MSVAMPKFKSTDRLNMFKKQLHLTVERLNDECLMESAKSLTKERVNVYDYLLAIYRSYISVIKEGNILDLFISDRHTLFLRRVCDISI